MAGSAASSSRAAWSSTWPRLSPHLAARANELELKGLIDEHVREEIAAREAVAMGLDRDDIVIKRRLRQKLEFLLVDDAAATPPTDAELQAWLKGIPRPSASKPQLAFRQVLLRPDRRGATLAADASKLLARLREAGPRCPRRTWATPRCCRPKRRWSPCARWRAPSVRNLPTR